MTLPTSPSPDPDVAIARDAQAALARGDLASALGLLRRHVRAHPRLATLLGEILILFVGTLEAVAEAIDALGHAEPEDPAAGYLLAWIAAGGRALPFDAEAIDARLTRAAEHGHPLACRALALATARWDRDAARAWLARAMRAGDPVAALLLAERWRAGEGDPDERRALATLDEQLTRAGHPRLPAIGARAVAPGAARGVAALVEPPPSTRLAAHPRVERLDALLTDDECRFVIALGRPLLKRSTVHDPSTGDVTALPVRTSSDASFDLIHEDLALRLLLARLARAAGLDVSQAEPLILLHYRPGEAYRPHRDYLAPSALAASRPDAGQRRTTVCAYLNTVEAGGGTAFPELGIESAAVSGSAIVFDNLAPDGAPEPRSLHAGQPVERGEKWLATLWLRERPLRAV